LTNFKGLELATDFGTKEITVIMNFSKYTPPHCQTSSRELLIAKIFHLTVCKVHLLKNFSGLEFLITVTQSGLEIIKNHCQLLHNGTLKFKSVFVLILTLFSNPILIDAIAIISTFGIHLKINV
jgi:hypothetical protein